MVRIMGAAILDCDVTHRSSARRILYNNIHWYLGCLAARRTSVVLRSTSASKYIPSAREKNTLYKKLPSGSHLPRRSLDQWGFRQPLLRKNLDCRETLRQRGRDQLCPKQGYLKSPRKGVWIPRRVRSWRGWAVHLQIWNRPHVKY